MLKIELSKTHNQCEELNTLNQSVKEELYKVSVDEPQIEESEQIREAIEDIDFKQIAPNMDMF